ncbi:flagellin lysine-N-methylase [Clostridium sp. BJN0001]|uniref:flagellin lysine-N-methylase n=1 Tax=Clostridium sp. BJN0001 TaxID=2930219 RepID=UPI0032AFB3D0
MKKVIEYPEYVEKFKCIGGSCEDSCCIGWDVDIDKSTFKSYFKVKNEEMKNKFCKYVHNNTEFENKDIDYGKMKLLKGKRCPFLDDNNYCIIFSKVGEEYLSNVCTFFPRTLNKIEENYEISLDVSCPEASRLVLLNEDGIKFKKEKMNLNKYILSCDINFNGKKDTNIEYLMKARKKSIEIIQKREFTLRERLIFLGDFLEKLEDTLENNILNTDNFIDTYSIKNIKGYSLNDKNYIMQVVFYKNLIEFLDVDNEVDSKKFIENTENALKGFKINKDSNITKDSVEYVEYFKEYQKNFLCSREYIFENYIVNFMYQNLFPFSETESPLDGYVMLILRVSLMRFYLTGLFLYNKQESDDNIVKFIQNFSKTLEHHKTYLIDILTYIKDKEFDNIEFIKSLI